MKRKGLLKLIFPISLVSALVLGVSLTGGCAAPTGVEGTILIGSANPQTGYLAAIGVQDYQGIEFAVSDINAAGGLLGRRVDIVRYDTGELAPETLRSAAEYMNQRGVVMTYGGWSGWGADVTAFGEYDQPFFHLDAAISSIEIYRSDPEKYSNVFTAMDIEAGFGADVFNAMATLPYEYPNNKIALIASDDAWGRGYTDATREAAEEAGWETVMYEVVPYGTTEWGGILEAIRGLEPAWISFEVASVEESVTFVRQFKENPVNSLILAGASLSIPEFSVILGEEATGIIGQGSGLLPLPPPTQETAEWAERFESKYGYLPPSLTTFGYYSVMVWAEAVRQVGDPTDYDAITEWLSKNSFEGIPGLGAWHFDEDQKIPLTVAPFAWSQFQDDRTSTIYWGEPGYTDYQGESYEFQVPPWIK